jgi:N-acetyl-gamma-glutamyl-phosphate reductase
MQKIPGLKRQPLFSPIVADYYSGMVVSVPLYTEFLHKVKTQEEVQKAFTEFYKEKKFIQVMPWGAEAESGNMLSGNACSGFDGLKIYVTGNQDRLVLSSQFDNLGKGASGAAIQCLNIAMGCEETKGLCL